MGLSRRLKREAASKVMHVITSDGPKSVRMRYVYGDEVYEREITLSRTMRFIVELFRDS